MVSQTGFLWCVLFFVLGPLLILVNNYVFNTVHYKFPIMFSSLGIWGTAIVTQGVSFLGLIKIDRKITFNYWLTRIVPVGLLSAATIGSGNSVYLYLSVSFTQMLKALTPVYILLCLVLFRVEIPKSQVVASVVVISFGTAIASLGELKFSWTGFFLQSLADIFEGLRLVLLQILMSSDSLSPIQSMYYVSPATAVSQFLLVLLYERPAIASSASWQTVFQHWYLFLVALVLGTAINFTGLFVIKHTSGLMLKLIGVVRNNCLVLFSVIFLSEKTTFLQMLGYVVSVAGFVWYTNLTQGGQSQHEKTKYKRDYFRVVDGAEMEEI
jgi:drug/metabolite transporter (DMT)-like permease